MPHLTIEYSANLAGRADIGALCRVAHGALMDSGLFEPGAPRVRAIACADYAVADLHPANAFADLVLRMGAGRGEADRAALGVRLTEVLEAFFAQELAGGHIALSLEIREIAPGQSWKRNAIHRRLRG